MSIEIKNISLFQGLDDAAFQAEIAQLPVRKLTAKSILFAQGSKSTEIYVLLSGSIEIIHHISDGAEELIATLQAGEVLGEFSYLTGLPRSSSARAVSIIAVMELRGNWLATQEAKRPKLKQRLLALYRERVLTNILHANKVFSVLHLDEIKNIVPQLSFKRYENGSLLFTEGDTTSDLYVIKKGHVEISKLKDNTSIKLGELGAGEVVGEMAVVTGQPRSATVRAIGSVEVMQLASDKLRECLNRYPALLENIEGIVRSRAEQTRLALAELIEEVVGGEQISFAEKSAMRAKMSLFVYPQYDARSYQLQLSLIQTGKFYSALDVIKMSLTTLIIAADEAWKSGETLKLKLLRSGAEILSTQGVFLAASEGLQFIQLEYNTLEERSAIESLVKEIAAASGYGQALKEEPQVAASKTVSKEFKTRLEFIRQYLIAMQMGLLTAPCPKSLAKDTPVKVQLMIQDAKESLRLYASGHVKTWQAGNAEIALDPASAVLKRKIEEMCQELIAEKNAASWEKRRKQLSRSGIRIPITFYDALRHPLFIAGAAIIILALGWVIYRLEGDDPFNELGSRSLKLMNAGAPLTMKVEQIKSLKLAADNKEFEIISDLGNLRLPMTQKIRLNEFQRQQLEMMLVDQLGK